MPYNYCMDPPRIRLTNKLAEAKNVVIVAMASVESVKLSTVPKFFIIGGISKVNSGMPSNWSYDIVSPDTILLRSLKSFSSMIS